MALTSALIITGIAIALLVVYASDVAVVEITGNEEGFIPFDHKTRGMGLGLPALNITNFSIFYFKKRFLKRSWNNDNHRRWLDYFWRCICNGKCRSCCS